MARRPSLHVAEQVFNLLVTRVEQVSNLPALRQFSLTALITLGLMGAPALAQTSLPPHPIPESQRWATITHPGNEAFVFKAYPGDPGTSIGRVDYEYQISRTEVTNGEWVEFVNAYARYLEPGETFDASFTGTEIGSNEFGVFTVIAGRSNRPVEISWRYAARYVNWLHNDRQPQRNAFENGVYDTSTFTSNPDGSINDQATHHPDAKFWIPTKDEWVKAAHWDPNKNGENQPGYFLYPTSSDTAPITGAPGVGETSGGGMLRFPVPDVASYTTVTSPWGLFDASGGYSEWTETQFISFLEPEFRRERYIVGSTWRQTPDDARRNDLISTDRATHPDGQRLAFRLSRPVPSAPVAVVFAMAYPLLIPRSNRRRS